MSIINSLKTFSKKAFNVEPNGSNIDEVLDDMASKVTPGSGGGSGIYMIERDSEERRTINATVQELADAKAQAPVLVSDLNVQTNIIELYFLKLITESEDPEDPNEKIHLLFSDLNNQVNIDLYAATMDDHPVGGDVK